MDAYMGRRAVALVKEGGARHLVRQMVHRLVSPLLGFGTVTLFVRKLDHDLPGAKACRDVQLRWASPSDVGLLRNGRDDAPSEDAIRERFARGDRCVLAMGPGGKLAHSRWITTEHGYIPELDVAVVLAPGEAYHYDGYTCPAFRGCGVDGMARSFILRSLRDAGVKRVCWYVRGDNPIAFRISHRWGQPSGTLRYVQLPGLRPVVLRLRALEQVTLMKSGSALRKQDERALRVRAWHEWFKGWLDAPLAKRSTGYHALSEEQFALTARHIGSTLELDPKSDFVLDVGCDSAMVSRLVAPWCRGFVGVDFISAMLTDISRERIRSADGSRAGFVAADGRALPFRSAMFNKAYCSAVIHTLPSHEDALKIIRELVRVCRPGGEVLIASVPDAGKRFQARMEVLRAASVIEKVKLAGWFLVPGPMKNVLRRTFRLARRNHLVFLEFDLKELKRELEKEGLGCDILDFPKDYWSRDFRITRSNVVIRIPGPNEKAVPHDSFTRVHPDGR